MKLSKSILTLLCGVTLLSTTAMAKPDHAEKNSKHGNQHNEKAVKEHDGGGKHESHGRYYKNEDKDFIRDHILADYSKNCPPGLAKKHNGCTPPGLAKNYQVGYILPDGLWRPVPRDILVLLRPAPERTQYVAVDDDILLISLVTKKIIEAIDY